MMNFKPIALAVAAWFLTSPPTIAAAFPPETITMPSFGTVTVYRPATEPREVVLFISGDGGWNLGVIGMAELLRDAGALVAGVDIRAFTRGLEASGGCAYPAGNLEELSRAVQLHVKLPTYKRPILVGYSSGATLVYAALAAAPPESFAGAISLGFCPDLELRKPLCQMRGLKASRRQKGGVDLAPFPGLAVPWMVLQGEIDQVCDPSAARAFAVRTGASQLFPLPKVGHGFGVQARWVPQFMEAYRTISERRTVHDAPKPAPAPVADLSLVEVAATEGARSATLAIMLTGDGGWADIDKRIAEGLVGAGIPVVGWSSLDYYWTPRTPETAARDLGRIIEYYTAAWRAPRVIVVGYSFGADVAAFLVNRLPPPLRQRISRVVLLGPSDTAAFKFRLASWLGGGGEDQYPTVPEIQRLSIPVTCVSASDDDDSVCDRLKGTLTRTASVGQGHHFGGDYTRLVELILK